MKKNIFNNFTPSEFHPASSVFSYTFPSIVPHYHTIIGSEALSEKIFGHMRRPFATKEERIETEDGDFFDVEYTDNIDTAKCVVIIVHGLESNMRCKLWLTLSN